MADLSDYREYLERFERSVGAGLAIGGYGKFQGRLVKKLTLDEFAALEADYRRLCNDFDRTVISGATINNRLLKAIRERAAELVLKPPG